MEHQVKEFLAQHDMEHRGKRLLLACSGGADSVALVRCFHQLAHTMQWSLGVVHADHQLRGEASHGDRVFVEQLAQSLELPVYAKALPVPERLQQGGNTQQVCRDERYTYFASVLHTYGYDVLVQGHHADDQIEAVLMMLAKGSESTSMGIPLQRPFEGKTLIRPFIGIERTTIEAYLNELGQSYREDASNLSDAYTRNRFRHHIIPQLYEESPSLARQIYKFVEHRQQEEDVLQELSQKKLHQLTRRSQNGHATLDGKGFRELPIALQRRVILLVWNYLQPNTQALSSQLLASLLTICQSTHGTQQISLPSGYQLTRSYDDLIFEKSVEHTIRQQDVIVPDQWMAVMPGVQLLLTQSLAHFEGERWYIDVPEDELPLRIRSREPGDRIHFGSHHKKVSRVFIDCKVPKEKREGWPLLVSQKNGILGLIGLRYSDRLNKDNQTPWVIWIKQEDSTC